MRQALTFLAGALVGLSLLSLGIAFATLVRLPHVAHVPYVVLDGAPVERFE